MLQYAPKDWPKCPECGVTMPPQMFASHKTPPPGKPSQCQRWRK